MKIYCYQQPQATQYYDMFPSERVLPNGDFIPVSAQALPGSNLLELLGELSRGPSAADFGIVCHGSGSGLLLPLTGNTAVKLEDQAFVCFKETATKQMTDKEAAKLLMLTPSAWGKLQEAIDRVRAKRLGRLVIRACILGGAPDTLEKIRQLFGCGSVCAPKALDVFGSTTAEIARSQKDWDFYKKNRPAAVIQGERPNRIAVDFDSGVKVQFFVMADSWNAVRHWVEAKLPAGSYKQGRFPLHCMLVGNRLLFPREDGFLANLGRVPS